MEALKDIAASAIINGLPRESLDTLSDSLLGDIYVIYNGDTGADGRQPNIVHVFRAKDTASLCEYLYNSDMYMDLCLRFYDFYSDLTLRDLEELIWKKGDGKWRDEDASPAMLADPYFYFCNFNIFPPCATPQFIKHIHEIIIGEMKRVRDRIMTLGEFLRRDWPPRVIV